MKVAVSCVCDIWLRWKQRNIMMMQSVMIIFKLVMDGLRGVDLEFFTIAYQHIYAHNFCHWGRLPVCRCEVSRWKLWLMQQDDDEHGRNRCCNQVKGCMCLVCCRAYLSHKSEAVLYDLWCAHSYVLCIFCEIMLPRNPESTEGIVQ